MKMAQKGAETYVCIIYKYKVCISHPMNSA